MKVGDWRQWLTEDLYANLTRVIEAKARRRKPYYIEVRTTKNYEGPAAANASLETETVTLKAKHVYGVRLVCMETKPIVPQLSTMLFYVDNTRGLVKLVYALPADKPNEVEDSDTYGPIATKVAEDAKIMDMPLIWN